MPESRAQQLDSLYSKLGLSGDVTQRDKGLRIAGALTRNTFPQRVGEMPNILNLVRDVRALLARATTTEVVDVLKDLDRLYPATRPSTPAPAGRAAGRAAGRGRGRGRGPGRGRS